MSVYTIQDIILTTIQILVLIGVSSLAVKMSSKSKNNLILVFFIFAKNRMELFNKPVYNNTVPSGCYSLHGRTVISCIEYWLLYTYVYYFCVLCSYYIQAKPYSTA